MDTANGGKDSRIGLVVARGSFTGSGVLWRIFLQVHALQYSPSKKAVKAALYRFNSSRAVGRE